ncbi:hypothetical protein [Yoonia sediminilitoris]|uniref:PepSY domain-containing protein n=1 Tax=Yoonia sediminilitoris TaxID=1286148 RepID=A0A2T6KM50_9RHOB|nr:hypothetical protein [Yoonia sediminilitoris]PUB17295.1 hypothetical protein C8N45_102307 [Yoonia sediminilitoris]RCW97590.1 hypothetical protein DFP92_102307 [Yoonia sediminilitoris]
MMRSPRALMVIRLICLSSFWTLPAAADADDRELSQRELRTAVASNSAIETRRLISGVEDYTGGDVVEIRAFLIDSVVTYSVLVRHKDGHIGSVMIDGQTGRAVTPDSQAGQQVRSLVASAPAASGSERGRANLNVSGTRRAPGRDASNNSRSNRNDAGRNGNSGRENGNNGGGNSGGGNNGGGKGNSGGNGKKK